MSGSATFQSTDVIERYQKINDQKIQKNSMIGEHFCVSPEVHVCVPFLLELNKAFTLVLTEIFVLVIFLQVCL